MEPLPMETNTVEKMMLRRAASAQRPINGSLELLPLCNMRCDMCYVRLSRSETEKKGGLRTADEWIRLGREMQTAGVLFLLLTGVQKAVYRTEADGNDPHDQYEWYAFERGMGRFF